MSTLIQQYLNNLNQYHALITNQVSNKFYFSDDYDRCNSTGNNCSITVRAMCKQADGKILIASDSGQYLFRLNADFSMDESFPNLDLDSDVREIALQSDGKIIIVGAFTSVGATTCNKIARLNSDGTLDVTFASGLSGFDGDCQSILVNNDNSMYVGGFFSSYNGTPVQYLVKLDSYGVLDTEFTNNISGYLTNGVSSIKNRSNMLYLASYDNMKSCNILGIPNGSFSSVNFNDELVDFDFQSDGKIIVVGYFDTVDASTHNKIARLNADGSLDDSFGLNSGSDAGVLAIKVLPDDSMIVGGDFTNIMNTIQLKVACLNSDGTHKPWNNPYDVEEEVYSIVMYSPTEVLIGGEFNKPYFKLVKYNVTTGEFLGGGLPQLSTITYWGISDGGEDLEDGGTFFNTSLTQPFRRSISYIQVTNGGSGYTTANVVFVGGGNTGAETLVYFDDAGSITSIDITNQGDGFYATPEIQIVGDGIGATAVVQNLYFNFIKVNSIPFTHTPADNDDLYNSLEEYSFAYKPTRNDSVTVSSVNKFGAGSRYFTAMYPGLLALVATDTSVVDFSIAGNSGADGGGEIEIDVFSIQAYGQEYTCYYRGLWDTSDPSYNGIIIVPGNSNGIDHLYDPTTERDDHAIANISDRREIFYILVTKGDHQPLTSEERVNLASAFVEIMKNGAIGPTNIVTDYDLVLTPALMSTEACSGNLDTSIINGKSMQRTGYMTLTDTSDSHKVKVVEIKDGEEFNNDIQQLEDLGFIQRVN